MTSFAFDRDRWQPVNVVLTESHRWRQKSKTGDFAVVLWRNDKITKALVVMVSEIRRRAAEGGEIGSLGDGGGGGGGEASDDFLLTAVVLSVA